MEWAARLVELAYVVQTDVLGDPMYNPDGTPVLEVGPDGRPLLNDANPGADAVLQRYVDDLDIFRQLTSTFERSLTDDDLPQP